MRISDWSSDVCSSDLRPEVDALENISPAILVDQERMGSNARSTVGTATDVHAMLRMLFSRLGQPHVGSPQAFSFNVPSVRGGGAVTFEKGGKTVKERRSFEITGGMCTDRTSVVSGKSVSVRVDLGGRRSIKNKT